MSGHEVVLGKIRRALGVSGGEADRRAIVAARLANPQSNLIPERGKRDRKGRIALFSEMAERVSATVERLTSPDDVPAAVAEHLRNHNLPMQVRTGADLVLASLPWDRAPHVERLNGASSGGDLVSLSRAFGGVAESGTLVLVSGEDNPTTLNFLPETHIVVLFADDIAGDYEAVFNRIRDQYGAGAMPRTVNLITGPSRSGDIEQTLILGAHGPRSLHILIVG